MPAKPSKFLVLTTIEAGGRDPDGVRELRKELGDEVTREELHGVGQSDEDISYLVEGKSLEPA